LGTVIIGNKTEFQVLLGCLRKASCTKFSRGHFH